MADGAGDAATGPAAPVAVPGAPLLRLKRPRGHDDASSLHGAVPDYVTLAAASLGDDGAGADGPSSRKRARLLFRRVEAPPALQRERAPRGAPTAPHAANRAAWQHRAAMVDGWYDSSLGGAAPASTDARAAARRVRDATRTDASRSRVFARRREAGFTTSIDTDVSTATSHAVAHVERPPHRVYELVSAPLGASLAAAASRAAAAPRALIHRLPPGYRSTAAAAVHARVSYKLVTAPAPSRVLPPAVATMCACIRDAIASGDLTALKAAVECGGDVNTQCVKDDLSTPLMAAVLVKDTQFALWLVRAGALARARDAAGRSAADLARDRGCVSLARVLAGVAADEEVELEANAGRVSLLSSPAPAHGADGANEDAYDTYELLREDAVDAMDVHDAGAMQVMQVDDEVLQEVQRAFLRVDAGEDDAAIAEIEADAYMYEEEAEGDDDDGEGSIDENDERFEGNDYPEEEGVVPSTRRGAQREQQACSSVRDIIYLDAGYRHVQPASASPAHNDELGYGMPASSSSSGAHIPPAVYPNHDYDDDDEGGGGAARDDSDDEDEQGSDDASDDDDPAPRTGAPRWRDVRRSDEFDEVVTAEDMRELQGMLASLSASLHRVET